MAIKDLAVAYNGSANADQTLRFALQMSKKYGAKVTALLVHAPLHIENTIARWATKEVLEQLRDTDAKAAEGIETQLHKLLAKEGVDGQVDWLVEIGTTNEQLARMARCYDILLMGQSSVPGQTRHRVRAEDLVVRMGRPLLVIPDGYEPRPFSEYAVVAWDGSRPASRALSDAMQILETKKKIDIVTVRPKVEKSGQETGESRVVRHLRRHGVDAEYVRLEDGKHTVGATILAYCGETRPDVLVMGAYGHARLREDLFGGVTHHILTRMNVPVLMSH